MKQFKIVIAAMLLGLAPATIVAQEFRASISGGVTDPTGAAVGGAHVVALSLERNVPYETTTNATGRYNIQYLMPGKYTMHIECYQTPPNMEGKAVKSYVPQKYQSAETSGFQVEITSNMGPQQVKLDVVTK